jgi:glycosyltransferase involved in cell wall biosynthesis
MKKKVFFVGDLNIKINKKTRFIGANKKIRIILSSLIKQGYDICNINSVPQMGVRQPMRIKEIFFFEKKPIKCLTIPTYNYNKLGRFKNIFDAKAVLQFAVDKFGTPDFVWCYNAYAFQMRFASLAKQEYKCPVILEFEDWHFSRSSIFNLKAFIDWYFWKKAIPFIDYCYAVNPWIEEKMKKNGVNTSILPGILTKEIINLKPASTKKNKKVLHIGYFGGLVAEKGGLLILELINLMKKNKTFNFKFHITGNGELMSKFELLSKSNPELVQYYGVVDDKKFNNIIGKMDILLNPHFDLKGVLPFKLLEYIASGRIVVSGPLNLSRTSLRWILSGVVLVHLKAQLWFDEIIRISRRNNLYDNKLREIRQKTIKLYSLDQFNQNLFRLFKNLKKIF